MAPMWDSEVLNCPYVNLPINAEQSHITSALIDLRTRAEFRKRQPQTYGVGDGEPHFVYPFWFVKMESLTH